MTSVRPQYATVSLCLAASVMIRARWTNVNRATDHDQAGIRTNNGREHVQQARATEGTPQLTQ
jgi:hypothetical protein